MIAYFTDVYATTLTPYHQYDDDIIITLEGFKLGGLTSLFPSECEIYALGKASEKILHVTPLLWNKHIICTFPHQQTTIMNINMKPIYNLHPHKTSPQRISLVQVRQKDRSTAGPKFNPIAV